MMIFYPDFIREQIQPRIEDAGYRLSSESDVHQWFTDEQEVDGVCLPRITHVFLDFHEAQTGNTDLTMGGRDLAHEQPKKRKTRSLCQS